MPINYVGPSNARGQPFRWHEIRELVVVGWTITALAKVEINSAIADWLNTNVGLHNYRWAIKKKKNGVRISLLFRHKHDAIRFKMIWSYSGE